MTFDEFLELTEDVEGSEVLQVDVYGRRAEVIDVEFVDGYRIIIKIED